MLPEGSWKDSVITRCAFSPCHTLYLPHSQPSAPGRLQAKWKASLVARTSARVQSSAEDAPDSSWEDDEPEEGHEEKETEGLVNMTASVGPQRQDGLGATVHLPSGGLSPNGVEHPVITAPPHQLQVSRPSTWTKEALRRNPQRMCTHSGFCTIM